MKQYVCCYPLVAMQCLLFVTYNKMTGGRCWSLSPAATLSQGAVCLAGRAWPRCGSHAGSDTLPVTTWTLGTSCCGGLNHFTQGAMVLKCLHTDFLRLLCEDRSPRESVLWHLSAACVGIAVFRTVATETRTLTAGGLWDTR